MLVRPLRSPSLLCRGPSHVEVSPDSTAEVYDGLPPSLRLAARLILWTDDRLRREEEKELVRKLVTCYSMSGSSMFYTAWATLDQLVEEDECGLSKWGRWNGWRRGFGVVWRSHARDGPPYPLASHKFMTQEDIDAHVLPSAPKAAGPLPSIPRRDPFEERDEETSSSAAEVVETELCDFPPVEYWDGAQFGMPSLRPSLQLSGKSPLGPMPPSSQTLKRLSRIRRLMRRWGRGAKMGTGGQCAAAYRLRRAGNSECRFVWCGDGSGGVA